jgi:proline iminopeptidase
MATKEKLTCIVNPLTRATALLLCGLLVGACSSSERAAVAGSDAGADGSSEPTEGAATGVDGVEIWYRTVGGARADAKTLLLMHGGPGLASNYLLALEQLAGPDLRVVRLDQRGVGGSARPSDGDYHMDKILGDIDAVTSKLGVDRFAFLGHSWGGLVAMKYAIRSPERVESLMLLDSMAPTSAENAIGFGTRASRVTDLQNRNLIPKDLPNQVTDTCGWAASILPAFFYDPTFEPPSELASNACDNEAARETWDQNGTNNYDITSELASLGISTLIVMGEGDFFAASADRTAEAFVPPATVRMIPKTGHFSWMEAPEATFSALRTTLRPP